MESPFDNQTITLYLEPVLNTYIKNYMNILTLSGMPTGPLKDLVAPIHSSPLSPFQQASPMFGNFPSCVYALCRYPKTKPSMNHLRSFMTADDIPAVLGYLRNNGYTVETSLVNMLHRGQIDLGGASETRFSGNRKLVCIFSSTAPSE